MMLCAATLVGVGYAALTSSVQTIDNDVEDDNLLYVDFNKFTGEPTSNECKIFNVSNTKTNEKSGSTPGIKTQSSIETATLYIKSSAATTCTIQLEFSADISSSIKSITANSNEITFTGSGTTYSASNVNLTGSGTVDQFEITIALNENASITSQFNVTATVTTAS